MISRIFRGENDNAASKRKRQIDTLKIFNDNVSELQEDVEYRVEFDAGDIRMAIMVSLSPEFPLEKPVLRVSPPIIHKWCNEHSEIVNAPGLLNFTVHSDLGRVVQAIIREFSKNPPKFVGDNSPVSNMQICDLAGRGSPSYSWKPQEYAGSSYTFYNPSFQQYSSSNTTPGVYNYNYTNANNLYSVSDHAAAKQYAPSASYVGSSSNSVPFSTASSEQQYTSNPSANAYLNLHYVNANVGPPMQNSVQYKNSAKLQCPDFPELENLTNDELKKLGQDEDLMDEFLIKHTKLKEIDTAVAEAIDSVEKTATMNIEKEQELQEMREEVAGQIETVSSLKTRLDSLMDEYNKLSEAFAPDNIRNCLAKAADESQEQSEVIAQDFLNRKIDVERFLSTYVECRKLGQARRTKEEKLAHQLNELKRTRF